jgi:hypothetical protein
MKILLPMFRDLTVAREDWEGDIVDEKLEDHRIKLLNKI